METSLEHFKQNVKCMTGRSSNYTTDIIVLLCKSLDCSIIIIMKDNQKKTISATDLPMFSKLVNLREPKTASLPVCI